MRSIFVPATIALLIIGWFISSVMADTGCNDLQSPDDSCTEQNPAFSIMLPYVSSHSGQNGENPPNPTSSPTLTLTSAPTLSTPSDGSPQPGGTPSSTPTPSSPTSSVPPTPSSGTPNATSLPSGTATSEPTQTPITALPLLSDPPSLTAVTQEGSGISLSWSGCGAATSARLLYGPIQSRPSELATTSYSLATPTLAVNGTYRVMVECYDEVGNSVFSVPATVEISGVAEVTQ